MKKPLLMQHSIAQSKALEILEVASHVSDGQRDVKLNVKLNKFSCSQLHPLVLVSVMGVRTVPWESGGHLVAQSD